MYAHGLLMAPREPWRHQGISCTRAVFYTPTAPLGVETGVLRRSGEGMFVEWREIKSVVLPRRPLVAKR